MKYWHKNTVTISFEYIYNVNILSVLNTISFEWNENKVKITWRVGKIGYILSLWIFIDDWF